MTESLSQFIRARQLATGSSLDVVAPDASLAPTSEAGLSELITAYYKFYNEDLSAEISFLSGIQPSPNLEALRRLLYNLRTASNHSDNPKAQDLARRWRGGFESPAEAAISLADAVEDALSTLAKVALDVARDPRQAERWKDLVSIDAGTVFSAVEVDLGLRFSPGNRLRMVRLVQKRLEVQSISGDRRTILADYCVQEMISDRRPLPVSYDKVLDFLGLLGRPNAVGAILAAHSVAALSPGLVGDAYLVRVRDTWAAASPPA